MILLWEMYINVLAWLFITNSDMTVPVIICVKACAIHITTMTDRRGDCFSSGVLSRLKANLILPNVMCCRHWNIQ